MQVSPPPLFSTRRCSCGSADHSMLIMVSCIGAVSTANGSALIRLGDTTVVCGIKAETAEPDWDRPNEGWLGESPLVSVARELSR